MNIRTILVLSLLLLSITTFCQETGLKVDGAIKIENSNNQVPLPGTIRWSGSDFLVWKSKKWISLTSNVAYDGEVIDADGNRYLTKIIGDQEWMAENLRTTKYADGSPISNVPGSFDWFTTGSGAWVWHDNKASNELPYGKLYNWYVINNGKEICPSGWDVPNQSEWLQLFSVLGGNTEAGGRLKTKGNVHWNDPNQSGTNESGFSALPGGNRNDDGEFRNFGNYGNYWSSIPSGTFNAICYNIRFEDAQVASITVDKHTGLSIRCIKE